MIELILIQVNLNEIDVLVNKEVKIWQLIACQIVKLFKLKEANTKGQLISKCPFGVFKYSKKPTKFFRGQNKKVV